MSDGIGAMEQLKWSLSPLLRRAPTPRQHLPMALVQDVQGVPGLSSRAGPHIPPFTACTALPFFPRIFRRPLQVERVSISFRSRGENQSLRRSAPRAPVPAPCDALRAATKAARDASFISGKAQEAGHATPLASALLLVLLLPRILLFASPAHAVAVARPAQELNGAAAAVSSYLQRAQSESDADAPLSADTFIASAQGLSPRPPSSETSTLVPSSLSSDAPPLPLLPASMASGAVADFDADGLLEGAGFEEMGNDVGPTQEYRRPGSRRDISPEEALALSGARAEDEANSLEAKQVHVSLWGPGRMLVTWVTGVDSAPSVVEFGDTPGELTREAQGESITYQYLAYRSGAIHRVILGTAEEPLLPNTTYWYQCSRSGSELSFKTPPDSWPLDVAIVGDLGQTEWSVSTLEHIQEDAYDMLILPGDLSYADRYQPRWDTWGTLIEPSASSRAWMTVPGNHEKEGIPFLEPQGFIAYNARWPMPHTVPPTPSPSNLFYSFETAGVHWLMLASYGADYGPESEQLRWLEADLAAVDRRRTPWLVAVLHAPWYNSNSVHQGDGEAMRRSLERVLYEARADVLFAGHVHAYERSARVYDNQLNPCGMVHITVGDGGNREGLATKYLEPQPPWSVRREASFGHGELKFRKDGSAEWLWHRNQDPEDVVADRVVLYPHPLMPEQVEGLSTAGSGPIDDPSLACPIVS